MHTEWAEEVLDIVSSYLLRESEVEHMFSRYVICNVRQIYTVTSLYFCKSTETGMTSTIKVKSYHIHVHVASSRGKPL